MTTIDFRQATLQVIAVVLVSAFATTAAAQELVPRAFWPTPNGTNLLVATYQQSRGDILTDPTLPVSGVDSTLNYLQLTYQRTLSVFDRTATLQFNLPYTSGTTEGLVEGQQRYRDIDAMGDARLLFAINLRGAPSMDNAAFQALRANPKTIIGASILVQAPTGAYDADRYINAGTNRWSVKASLGAIWPLRPKLLLESEVGVWLFGDNDEFVGATRTQKPVYSAQFHLVRRFKPGFWAALDLNYYTGGRTSIDGIERGDLQRNSRFGATAVFPLKPRHAIRASASTGVVTSSGADFDTFSLSYAYVWQ